MEIARDILGVILVIFIPIWGYEVITYLKLLKQQTSEKIENEYIENTILRAINIIIDVVDLVSNTFVKDIKESGAFTEEAKEKALNNAIDKAKELLDMETKELIKDIYNDLDKWIETQIEAYLNNKI